MSKREMSEDVQEKPTRRGWLWGLAGIAIVTLGAVTAQAPHNDLYSMMQEAQRNAPPITYRPSTKRSWYDIIMGRYR